MTHPPRREGGADAPVGSEPVGGVGRAQTPGTSDELALERDPARWFRWRGLIGGLVVGPAALFALLSPPPADPAGWAELVARLAAFLLFLAGVRLRLWGALYLGGRRTRVLVTDGPFSVCRNPLYLGSFLVALSVAVRLRSLLVALAVAVAAALYTLGTIRQEERMLRAAFPTTYPAYAAPRRRFLPRPSQFRTDATIQVHLRGLKHEFRRLLRLLLIPITLEVLLWLRSGSWFQQLGLGW